MKNYKNYLPIFIFSLLALLYFGAKSFFGLNQNASQSSKEKLNLLIDIISNEYVDEIDIDSIVTLTANSILEKLDPHSVYIPSSEFDAVSENMRGDFVGIGVNFFMNNDTISVLKAIEGGPSHQAGILSGDRILMADSNVLFGKNKSSDQIIKYLKGEEDSKVTLKIFRKSTKKTFSIPITRGVVNLNSIDHASVLNNGMGYIKINRFSETTYTEFLSHITRLNNQKINGLIIDLRDNAGGYMNEAIQIADEILAGKQLIVYTKDRKNKTEKTFASKTGIFEKRPVYVLINENSASASEILAGAIQDNDRGIIIGRRSFGKGLVQQDKALGDGSVVRLTIARYYTPTGRSIQKPYKTNTENYYSEFYKRFESGELNFKDSIAINDSLKFKTPKGKIVYGGGGIMPDVFVPIEEKNESGELFFNTVLDYISRYVFTALDYNRAKYAKMSPQQFVALFEKDPTFYVDFLDYIFNKKIPLDPEGNTAYYKKCLAGEYIRQLYGDQAYYDFMLLHDPMIEKVIGLKR